MSELEELVKEMRGDGFNVYQRTLPFGTNRVIALNVPTYRDAEILVKALKLKIKEEVKNGEMLVTFYDILPNSIPINDLLHNDAIRTTVGNDRRTIAAAYFDIGE